MSLAYEPLSEEERESLQRLLACETISRAPRLQSTLKFIVDSLVEGRSNEINEQAIGQGVFGRPAGYNPADDNIVRVTVRHLRTRLEQFYKTEGRDEKYVLEIPKGKYVPFLSPRTVPAPEALLVEEASEAPTVQSDEEPFIEDLSLDGAKISVTLSKFRLVIVLVTALFITSVALTYSLYAFYRDKQTINTFEGVERPGLLQVLLQHGNKVTVVVTDSNLQAYREIFKKQVSLDSYIDRSYSRSQPASSDPDMAGAWHYAIGTTETNIASAIVAAKLRKAAPPAMVDIKHPHDLSMRDLQRENVILLGGPWINPWGQLFEDRLNFRVLPREDAPAGSEIHNLDPLPGELRTFAPHQDGAMQINYVRIAFLPNLSNNGRVITIGATSLESLEAGGDFLVSHDSVNELERTLHVRLADQLPFFEIVLEVKGLDSVPQRVRLVAQREIKPPS